MQRVGEEAPAARMELSIRQEELEVGEVLVINSA